MTPGLLDLFQRFPLWDYSATNVRYLVSRGLEHAIHVPVGAFPPRPREPREERYTYDVAIIGAETRRRLAIARALSAAGLKVAYAVDVWGAERDELIRRSRILLNIHAGNTSLLETTRLNLLLSHSAFVVSEEGTDLE